MNNYPQWWDKTITIYVKQSDEVTHIIKWYRYVVSECFWKKTTHHLASGNSILEVDTIVCRIPLINNFLEKYQWLKLPEEQRLEYITCGIGDIIVCDDVDDVINEYISGYRSNDLLSKYKELQGCLEVQSIQINTGGGRNEEHYHIKGA